jgi:hypothetical protein
MGGVQLLARITAAALAAQPLPVQQTGAGQRRTQPGLLVPPDRLLVQVLSGRSVS